jgi:hypothetical protein
MLYAEDVMRYLYNSTTARQVCQLLIKHEGNKNMTYGHAIAEELGVNPSALLLVFAKLEGRDKPNGVIIPEKAIIERQEEKLKTFFKVKDATGLLTSYIVFIYSLNNDPKHIIMIDDFILDAWKYMCLHTNPFKVGREAFEEDVYDGNSAPEDEYIPLEKITSDFPLDKVRLYLHKTLNMLDEYENKDINADVINTFITQIMRLLLQDGYSRKIIMERIKNVLKNNTSNLDFNDCISGYGFMTLFQEYSELRKKLELYWINADDWKELLDYKLTFDDIKEPDGSKFRLYRFWNDNFVEHIHFFQRFSEEQRKFYWRMYLLLFFLNKVYSQKNEGALNNMGITYENLKENKGRIKYAYDILKKTEFVKYK